MEWGISNESENNNNNNNSNSNDNNNNNNDEPKNNEITPPLEEQRSPRIGTKMGGKVQKQKVAPPLHQKPYQK